MACDDEPRTFGGDTVPEALNTFMSLVDQLSNTAMHLGRVWEHIDPHVQVGSTAYPFTKDFTEVILDIISWKHACEQEVFEHLRRMSRPASEV